VDGHYPNGALGVDSLGGFNRQARDAQTTGGGNMLQALSWRATTLLFQSKYVLRA